MSGSNLSVREFAALAYALGVARGALQSALQGNADAQELRQVLDGTSTASIARAIGQTESGLSLDWNKYLTQEEKRAIAGARDD